MFGRKKREAAPAPGSGSYAVLREALPNSMPLRRRTLRRTA
ncbi:hypothetical protein ACFQWB_06225 [Paenibacillus thermoaerophilus]|uniref:Uncharacterized protein n=1 Tax=Paenibacillus thermoaerophilus TaxID=1215385 RepID=A0ABW2V067_9BACL|nr:hypothetical protein [Paenibacillus thermoaerophilus]